jgi:hypothetical protein
MEMERKRESFVKGSRTQNLLTFPRDQIK